MLQSLKGVYRNGKVELREKPRGLRKTRVIVTFLPEQRTPATQPKLSRKEAAELRARLGSWEKDWDAPGMEAYDTEDAR